MDPDYIAFRELVRQAEQDPALAAALTRAMREGWDLRDVLALASSATGVVHPVAADEALGAD